jgi:hypothetical protein
MEETIPQGVQTVSKLSNESADVLWQGLKRTLNTPDKIERFNGAITKKVAELKNSGLSKFKIAEAAMAHAGDVVLGTNRPADPNTVEGMLNTACDAGILRRTNGSAKQRETNASLPGSGILFR